MPSSSARSAMISLAPPDGVTNPNRLPGSGPVGGQQPGRDDEVLQAVDPDHARAGRKTASTTASSPTREPVWARATRAPVWLRPTLIATIGLPAASASRASAMNSGRLADRLDEQRDHPGGVVVDEVAHDVGHRHHRLVAHRHQQADADVAGLREGQHRAGEGPALQHDPDRAAQQRVVDGQAVGGDAGGGVDEPVAVGAEDGETAASGQLDYLPLQLRAILPHLGEAGGQQDHRRDAGVGHLGQHAEHGHGRHHHEGQVDRLREVGDAGVAVLAVHRDPARVDQVHRPAEAVQCEVAEDAPGPAGLVGRADQRDRPRVEQPANLVDGAVETGGCVEVCHQSPSWPSLTWPLMRFLAIVRRWISSVPSKMRSSRSSRYQRSIGSSLV